VVEKLEKILKLKLKINFFDKRYLLIIYRRFLSRNIIPSDGMV